MQFIIKSYQKDQPIPCRTAVNSSCLGPIRNNCSLVRCRLPVYELAVGGGVARMLRGGVQDDRLVVSSWRPPGVGYHPPVPRTMTLRLTEEHEQVLVKKYRIKTLTIYP